jgi:hypothetical protein
VDEEIDYKNLLKKYIDHVGSIEGVTFLGCNYRNYSGHTIISDEEWTELQKLDNEVNE